MTQARLIDEYWTQGAGNSMEAAFARSGSSLEMIKIIARYFSNMVEWEHPSLDYFIMNCTCDIIRQYKPEFMMIHPANIDGARHRYGTFNEKIDIAVEQTDRWIGQIMALSAVTRPAISSIGTPTVCPTECPQ
jgi:predicted AlkP superfamily pyrophosphatase or phosphodiesterase